MSKLKSRLSSNIMVYNPDLLSKEEIIEQFVARVPLLNRIIEDLRKSGGEGGNQHHLLIGQRGAGKTTLLRRIAYAIEDDAELSQKWIPLIFREEQVNVFRLSDFWVNCLDALSDYYERMEQTAKFEKLDDEIAKLSEVVDEKARAKKALDKLIERAKDEKRGLILLIDNLDLILDRLPEDHWTIREIMSHDKELLFIGATASAIESTYEYKGAFYDFFRTHELRGLSEKEAKEVLLNIAKLKNEPQVERILAHDPARFKTLHILTGGNPRTIILLYTLFARGEDGNVNQDLESLLDSCTPLYQDRVAALSTQAQLIVDTLALRWHPATAAEIAKDIRFEVNPTSAQIARLVNQGIVEKVPDSPNGKTLFQITERFFNIWYLMRASRRVRRRLIWLVEFLKLFYTSSELHSRGRRFLSESSEGGARNRTKRAEYGFALAQSISDSPMSHALESKSVGMLFDSPEKLKEMLDLEGEDKRLQPIVDRHAAIKEIKDLINARTEWGDCIAEEFCDLLIGNNIFPLSAKRAIARGLKNYSQEQTQNLMERLQKQEQHTVRFFGSDAITALKRAICEGYLESGSDVDHAQSAALAENYPALEAIICAIHLGNLPTKENIIRLQKCLKEAESGGAWVILGNALGTNKRFDEAEQAFRRAIEMNPNLANPFNGLGNVLNEFNRFEEAEQAFRRAIEIDPNNSSPFNGLGNALSDLIRFNEAEQAYRRAIEIHPNFATAWANLGRVLGQLKRFDEAEQAYRRAIEIDPTDSTALADLGSVLLQLKRFEEAEQACRQAIGIEPNDATAWANLGAALGGMKQFKEAEQACRRAIEIDPNYAVAWCNLGISLNNFEQLDETEQAFRRAIEIDSKLVAGWYNLAVVLNHFKRFDEAEQAYRRFMELEPNDAEALNSLAWLLFVMERATNDAEEAARKANELEKDNPFFIHTLACILLRQGKWEEAENLARRFITEADDEFHQTIWADIVTFFKEAVAKGYAANAVELLRDTGNDERWQPLYEALKVIAEGSSASLYRLSPEIRMPAEEVIKQIAPDFSLESADRLKKAKKKPVRRKRIR